VPTLFCDLGGVVFADSPEAPLEKWREANGDELGVVRADDLVDEALRGFESGRVGEAEYALHLRARLGWQGSDDDLIAIWNSSQGAVVLEVLDALSALRERGWALVAATNTDPWRLRARQEQFGWVLSMFDRVVTSVEVGARKPDPRFFAEMLRGVPRHGPQIYVDDDPQVVSAARRAGLDAHVFAGATGLRAACQSLNLTAH
jgi:HAD superfamily hydrolase (TIGR01509 family)